MTLQLFYIHYNYNKSLHRNVFDCNDTSTCRLASTKLEIIMKTNLTHYHNKDQEVNILIMTSDSHLSDYFISLIASHSSKLEII